MIVVVQRLFLNVLILSCKQSVSQTEILCSLDETHRLNITLNLEVEIPLTDYPPSEHHDHYLANCATPCVFELVVDRERKAGQNRLGRVHFKISIIKFNNVPSAVFEPEHQA